MRSFRLIAFFGIVGLMGCSQGFQVSSTGSASNAANGGVENGTPTGGTGTPPTPPTITPPPTTPSLGICSKLDFVGVEWPKALVEGERKAMALALNITGSFEGSAGWANLGSNFDGQGMSLGLSQQNLGQGTLQPLLQRMVAKQASTMSALFSTANLKSMTTMLKPWVSSAALVEAQSDDDIFGKYSTEAALFSDDKALNALDEGYRPNEISTLDAKTNASVAWAKATVYQSGGGVFKTDWKNSFLTLAVTAPYRSLQINAAMTMFAKAAGYFDSLKFTQLRSLLFMYDVVVQNGGFTSTHLANYRSYLAANPRATETARLTKLMEIRVASVLPRYMADVRARKTTIINGTGTVHGAKRDLQKEYCFASAETVP
ncbi:hypothetical protein BH10BDE1_BH10BDE1_32700 [soil metagenome]